MVDIMTTHKALVVGAQGVIGRSVAEHLSTRPGWEVIGVSRRTAQDTGKRCGI